MRLRSYSPLRWTPGLCALLIATFVSVRFTNDSNPHTCTLCVRFTSYFVVREWRLRQASERHPRWLRICLELLKIGDVSCRATEKLLAFKSADAAECPKFLAILYLNGWLFWCNLIARKWHPEENTSTFCQIMSLYIAPLALALSSRYENTYAHSVLTCALETSKLSRSELVFSLTLCPEL